MSSKSKKDEENPFLILIKDYVVGGGGHDISGEPNSSSRSSAQPVMTIEELQARLDALERKAKSEARQRRGDSARDFTSIVKDLAHSRDETERAYAYLAEKASEELKKETPGRHNFGAWQAAATKLPEDSVTRALIEDEDTRTMTEEEYAIRASVIGRALRHEVSASHR